MASKTVAGLAGIVLAGGLSSRLGRDKAQLRLGGDGADLLDRTVALLGKLCGRVLVVGRQHPEYPCLVDDLPGQGPAGGIATALRTLDMPCLVLSCDLPFMHEAVLRKLVAAHAARPAGALCTSYKQAETGRMEALVAIYQPECLPYLQACLEKGLLKISRAVPEALQHFLPYPADKALPFFNINSPVDLEAALRMCREADFEGARE